MMSLTAVLVSMAALLGPPPSRSGPVSEPVQPAADTTCVAVWTEARYANYGYNHIVHLRSSCAATVVCGVATNVNPMVNLAVVNPNEHVEVLTFRASPSRAFVARAECR